MINSDHNQKLFSTIHEFDLEREYPEERRQNIYIKMSADSTNDDSLYPIAVLIDEVGAFSY